MAMESRDICRKQERVEREAGWGEDQLVLDGRQVQVGQRRAGRRFEQIPEEEA